MTKQNAMLTAMKHRIQHLFGQNDAVGKKNTTDREQQQDLLYHFVKKAEQEGRDVNEWLEATQGWPPAQPILQRLVFPHIPNEATLCEIGPGVGRQARYLAAHPSVKALHLVDNSAWKIRFLQEYFRADSKVVAHHTDGASLAFLPDSSIDVAFSGGCFISFQLRTFRCYAREFARALKPGGVFVMNYLDIDTDNGWKHFEAHGCAHGGEWYSYYAGRTVDKLFATAGLESVSRDVVDDFSIYLTVRKPK